MTSERLFLCLHVFYKGVKFIKTLDNLKDYAKI